MNEFSDQISAYFSHVPMWPLVLLGVGIVVARKKYGSALNEARLFDDYMLWKVGVNAP